MNAPVSIKSAAQDPLLPRIELRLGITGHRPPRLRPENLDRIRSDLDRMFTAARVVLEEIQLADRHLFSPERPRIVLVSPLAEGTDQLAAEVALAAGETIDACLPFSAKEYRNDFEGSAAERFDHLLSRARNSLTLPGETAERAEAYRAVGEVTAAQCDILLAVWDGEPARGIGGTPEIIENAVSRALPVIVVDANAKAGPRLLWNRGEDAVHDRPSVHTVGSHDALELLPELIRNLIRPPEGSAKLLADTRNAGDDGWLRPVGYQLLLAATGAKSWKTAFRKGTYSESAAQIEPLLGFFEAPNQSDRVASQHLVERFASADLAANQFANRYRDGFVISFAMSALAVALALAGLLAPDFKFAFVTAEVLTITAILVRTRKANKSDWHRRWLDARHLAELLRLLPLAAALGDLSILRHSEGERRNPHDWYAQATARAINICHGEVDRDRVLFVKRQSLNLLEDQIRYHQANRRRMKAVDHRLHQVGEGLFILTIISGIGWLIAKLLHLEHTMILGADATTLAVVLGALLPAIGAALYGIRKQGDFAGSSERSRVSMDKLLKLRLAIERDPPDYRRLTDRVRRMGEIMLAEVDEWRLLCAIRPLELPG